MRGHTKGLLIVVMGLSVLTGCIHGGRDITDGGVTTFSGRTGAFDSGNTEYQHTFCEGGEPYTDEYGKFQCDGGHVVYRYTSVTSPSVLSQIIGLGGPAAIAYAGHEIGQGIGESGSTTNVNQQGGGATQSQGQVQGQQSISKSSARASSSSRSSVVNNPPMGRMD